MEFTRRNSLIKKKQEQWAKEKDEKEAESWFPFGENGSPGGGRPLRKHESIPSSHSTPSGQPPSVLHSQLNRSSSNIEASHPPSMTERTAESHCNEEQMNSSMYSMHITSPHLPNMQYPYGMYPYPVPMPVMPRVEPTEKHYPVQPGAYQHPYGFLPPGAYPVPCEMIASSAGNNKEPVCPAALLQSCYSRPYMWNGYGVPAGAIPFDPVTMTTSTGVAVQPSCSNANPTEATEHKPQHEDNDHLWESFREDSQMSDSLTLPSRLSTSRYSRAGSVGLSVEEIEAQIEEKRKYDFEKYQQERFEEERVERERIEYNKREEAERKRQEQEEDERRRILAHREAEIAAALEKAKKEADAMKKAKLYRHIIGGSSDNAAERLGIDGEEASHVLEKLTSFEKMKKKEMEEIERVRPKDTKKKSTPTKTGRLSSTPQRSMTETRKSPQERNHCSPCSQVISPKLVCSQDRPIHPAKGGKFFDENDDSLYAFSPFSSSNVGRRSLRLPSKPVTFSQPRAYDDHTISFNENRQDATFDMPSTPNSRIPVVERNRVKSSSSAFGMSHQYDIGSSASPSTTAFQSNHQRAPPIPKPRNIFTEEENPLFCPIATRSRRMRTSSDAPALTMTATTGSLDSNDGTTSGSDEAQASPQQSPIPTVFIETPVEERDVHSLLMETPKSESQNRSFRSRSALSSPAGYLNSGRQSPLRTSIYARKIAEKGLSEHNEDTLSPTIRKSAEASLSRNGSFASLRGSLTNLRASITNLNVESEELSPNIGKYRSMNPEYRSFNMGRKNSERQLETLARLNKLREQIRSKENYIDRTTMLSRQPSNQSIRQ